MADDLQKFIDELRQEVHGRVGELDNPIRDPASAFTEIMMECLAEAGIIENAVQASFNERIGRGVGKINGYALAEEEDTLDLFITVFLDTTDTKRLPPEEVRRAVE